MAKPKAKPARVEYNKILDRNDEKWAHPLVKDCYINSGRKTVEFLANPEASLEARIENKQKTYDSLCAAKAILDQIDPELAVHGTTVEYEIPGCPEEPEIGTTVVVRTPNNKQKEAYPAIFYCSGGALVFGTPYLCPIEEICRDHNAVVVAPFFRSGVDAPYPAAINDLHAGYQWMMENAEKLHIDPDRVVLTGMSSGGHLALALAFRLKRYGYRPRGVVAQDPVTDDRQVYPSQRIYCDAWDGSQLGLSAQQWMGWRDYNSAYMGPESFPNHADAEDCRGLCPVFIHTGENDPDRDANAAFISKLHEVGIFAERHEWGGCCHTTLFSAPHDNELRKRYMTIVNGNIDDCLNYDMRRSFLEEEE